MVPRKVAVVSKLIRNIIDDNGEEDPVPLMRVSESILALIIEYMTYVSHSPKPKIHRPLLSSDLK